MCIIVQLKLLSNTQLSYTIVLDIVLLMVLYRHSKQSDVYKSSHAVTGLAFKTSSKNVVLFVATMGQVLSINISGKDKAPVSNMWICLNI